MEKIIVNVSWCDKNYGAALSDNVPGAVVVTAKSYDELIEEVKATLQFHVEGMIADGDDVPFAFISNGNIIIIGAEAGAVLQIVDVLGHVIVSTDVACNVSTNGMTPGVYVLRLINGNDIKTQKIVID